MLRICLLIIGLSLFSGCDLMTPLPMPPKPSPTPTPDVVSPDQELSIKVRDALEKDDAPDADIAVYYGLFSALAEAVNKPELTKTKHVDDVIIYTNDLLKIKPKRYPTFSAVAGGSLDSVAGVPGASKVLELTPELRTKYAKTCQAIAAGCHLAL